MTDESQLPLPPPPPPLDHPVSLALIELIANIYSVGDVDDSMDEPYVSAHPMTRFSRALHEYDPEALRWLAYFVARRALACWEYSIRDNARPRNVVEALGRYLQEDGIEIDWHAASKATRTPFHDCRYSDTQSASDAVAECARYFASADPLHVAFCIGYAKCAYEHVLCDDQFPRWLLEVAVPVALEKREMTPAEREALRGGRDA